MRVRVVAAKAGAKQILVRAVLIDELPPLGHFRVKRWPLRVRRWFIAAVLLWVGCSFRSAYKTRFLGKGRLKFRFVLRGERDAACVAPTARCSLPGHQANAQILNEPIVGLVAESVEKHDHQRCFVDFVERRGRKGVVAHELGDVLHYRIVRGHARFEQRHAGEAGASQTVRPAGIALPRLVNLLEVLGAFLDRDVDRIILGRGPNGGHGDANCSDRDKPNREAIELFAWGIVLIPSQLRQSMKAAGRGPI